MADSGTPDLVAHATPPPAGLDRRAAPPARSEPVIEAPPFTKTEPCREADSFRQADLGQRLKDLNAIGIALSRQKDMGTLLETILDAAKRLTNADAGTLYLVDRERQLLRFELLRNDTLQLALGGHGSAPIDLAPVPLYDEGVGNHHMIVSHCVLARATINIPDAYEARGFDFSGTRNFDASTGYRSQSFLTVPMHDHENETIGVLQLINAQAPGTRRIVPFSQDDQQLLESLASQAAIALTNRNLLGQLEALFESFIGLINTAIDEKSAYTGGHCARVPVLTMMLADAATRTQQGPLKDFTMTDGDRHELKIAGLLHDCGKITTPVHVVDKATKLHTLFDRIELLDTRFDVLTRDADIALLQARLDAGTDTACADAAQQVHAARIAQLEADRAFLRHCNIGSERMSDADQARVRQIAQYRWRDSSGALTDFLNEDEVENLTIRSGTLTAAERAIINHHIVATLRMLEALPWPRHLSNVPEYAGGHHERMDGTGYPRGLTQSQMSVQARVMGIADIFEALTAKDRPYKPGKTLTEALTILGRMKLDGHVDPDLFDVFIRERVYLQYAREFLAPEQIDEVDLRAIPGIAADCIGNAGK
ncbi:MAG TPA: HD domain-containing phosphohydrolase [Pseudomonadales bacterium]